MDTFHRAVKPFEEKMARLTEKVAGMKELETILRRAEHTPLILVDEIET